MARMGRPSKLTAALTERLCGLLRDGVPQEAATLPEWTRHHADQE